MPTFTLRQIGPASLEVSRGNWKFTIDPGPNFGGNDAGPTPTELTAISLAACKAITAMVWMNRKGKPVTGTETEVNYEYADKPNRLGKITTTLRNFKNQIDPALHQRLEQIIEDHCWVAQTFENKPEMETRIE